jgi:hypothetical protein
MAMIGLITVSLLTLMLTDSLPALVKLVLSGIVGSAFYAALLFWLDDDWRQIVTDMINYARETVKTSA